MFTHGSEKQPSVISFSFSECVSFQVGAIKKTHWPLIKSNNSSNSNVVLTAFPKFLPVVICSWGGRANPLHTSAWMLVQRRSHDNSLYSSPGSQNTPKQRKHRVQTVVGCLTAWAEMYEHYESRTPTFPTRSGSEAAVSGRTTENNSDYSVTGMGCCWIERRQSCCNIPILLLTRRAGLSTPCRKPPAVEVSLSRDLLIVPKNSWRGISSVPSGIFILTHVDPAIESNVIKRG